MTDGCLSGALSDSHIIREFPRYRCREKSLKRFFDVILIFLTAPIWLPAMLIIAVAVRVALGSPVCFKQERPGLGGNPFQLVKFRSMTDERDSSGALLPDAQRLPPFGRFLRATSLDELPEIINVLRGEMSLVGPRPLLMDYLPLYTGEQARRHEVRPGITGWAQINGRNALSWEDKFRLDVWYVDNHTLALDVRILFLTFAKVVRREGIHAEGSATVERFKG